MYEAVSSSIAKFHNFWCRRLCLMLYPVLAPYHGKWKQCRCCTTKYGIRRTLVQFQTRSVLLQTHARMRCRRYISFISTHRRLLYPNSWVSFIAFETLRCKDCLESFLVVFASYGTVRFTLFRALAGTNPQKDCGQEQISACSSDLVLSYVVLSRPEVCGTLG